MTSEPTKQERILAHLAEIEAIDEELRRRAPSRISRIDDVRRLQEEIEAGDRGAFYKGLHDTLLTEPSLGALKQLAEADPLKHAQVKQINAKLAGVTEKHEVSSVVQDMSTSEMFDALKEMGFLLQEAKFPHEIEGELTDAKEPHPARPARDS